MKRESVLLVIFLCFSYVLQAQNTRYWQQQVNSKIDVTLNDVSHTLDGYIKMEYTNNSPDTLQYIFIHLWQNAFKNDRTAFSNQQIENGSTEFYFSSEEKRGYTNRLNFRVNNTNAKTEDDSQHQDIVKLLLPQPLIPGTTCKIETPFHVKLPYNFSRGGHINQSYQITQWYPKPAVYDHKGWHAIPYLDQGEFYSEFGNYEVQITLPENYVVAATGNLQESDEKEWLKNRKSIKQNLNKNNKSKLKVEAVIPASATKIKTLHYTQENIHDFAWFADKTFAVKSDTLQLSSDRVINIAAFYYPENEDIWSNVLQQIKQAILTKSKWLGEYPYNTVSVVEDERQGWGMEYPTITYLSSGGSRKMLDFVINHEVGHNWFYGILASNERKHPWMDEGMNTYYDNRYLIQQYGNTNLSALEPSSAFFNKRLPKDIQQLMLQAVTAAKKDQPIATASENFSSLNYSAIAYTKAGNWMQLLEQKVGKELFDSCMKVYYKRWGFKHPYPEDFKSVMEEVSGKKLDSVFSLLHKKGALINTPIKKTLRLTSFFNANETDKHNYIFAAPLIGVYNFYDKLMQGAIIHNYTLPQTKFQFFAAPLYAIKSKSINGLSKLGYTFYTNEEGAKLQFAISGARFNGDSFTDSTGTVNYQYFSKLVPAIKYTFSNKTARSSLQKFIEWKTFLITEQGLLFTRDTVKQIDIISYPAKKRYVNQLRFVIENNRALYPYSGIAMAEQGDGFIRTSFTGNYYFNYAQSGGLNLRVFAGKFFYTGDKTFITQFETDRYHLNMTGPKGDEDYTYSNYFYGRNEFDKISSQQIMIRDGGFKVRTDLLSSKVGKTDNWLAAANFTTTLPDAVNPLKVLPVKIPLKIFIDIGTYAEAWKKNAASSRFIYDAGLQLSLFKNVVNIYMPLLYSKVYKDYFISTIPEKRFIKNIAFSIDLQNISLKKLFPEAGF